MISPSFLKKSDEIKNLSFRLVTRCRFRNSPSITLRLANDIPPSWIFSRTNSLANEAWYINPKSSKRERRVISLFFNGVVILARFGINSSPLAMKIISVLSLSIIFSGSVILLNVSVYFFTGLFDLNKTAFLFSHPSDFSVLYSSPNSFSSIYRNSMAIETNSLYAR